MKRTYIVTGKPATKKTSQRIVKNKAGRSFIIPSKLTSDWNREAIRQLKAQHRGEPLTGEVVARYDVYRGARRGDLSNFISAIDDALQAAGVIGNDNQIVAIIANKLLDRENPRVEIVLTSTMEEIDVDP